MSKTGKITTDNEQIVKSSLWEQIEQLRKRMMSVIRAFYEKHRSLTLASLFGLPTFIIFLIPLYDPSRGGLQTKYLLSTLAFVFLFAAIALTLNLEIGYLGIPNFGKVAFLMVGGYAYAIFTTKYGWSPLGGVLMAMIITGLFGVLLTIPTLKLREDYLAIVTIVAGEILRNIANNQPKELGGFSGFNSENPIFKKFSPDLLLAGVFLDIMSIAIVWGVLGISFITYLFYYRRYLEHFSEQYAQEFAMGKSLTWTVIISSIVIILNYYQWYSPNPLFGIDMLLIILTVGILLYKTVWKGAIVIIYPKLKKGDKPYKKIGYGLIRFQITPYQMFGLYFLGTVAVSIVYYLFPNSRNITTRFNAVNWYNTLATLGVLMITFVIMEELYYSPFGRTLRSIREDDTSSLAVGKSLFIFRLKALVISSVISGLVGAMYAMQIFAITPQAFLPIITFNLYIMVIIGGTGNNKGVIYGAFLIQILIQATRRLSERTFYYPFFTPKPVVPGIDREVNPFNLALIVVGISLIVFLIYAPEGIFPEDRYGINRKYREIYEMEKGKTVELTPYTKLLMEVTRTPKEKLPITTAPQEKAMEVKQ